MKWWAELIGSESDLSILSEGLARRAHGAYSIVNEGQRWFLVQEDHDNVRNVDEIRANAQDLLDLLNGALITTGLPCVRIGDKIGRYLEDNSRVQMHLVELPISLSVRSVGWSADDEVAYKSSSADSIARRLDLAGQTR